MNSQTVDDLKIMSLNPLSSRLIGQDFTCIGGLILLLSNAEEKVISDILEIFHNLIINDSNKQYLKEFIGIKQQLECLESKFLSGTLIHLSATKLKKKLFKDDLKRHKSIIKKEPKSKDGFKIRNSRSYAIELKGLNDMTLVEEIKNNLVNLNGVMSITFQLKKKRVIVRACSTLTEGAIVEAISTSSDQLSAEIIGLSKSFNDITLRNCSIGSNRSYFPEPATVSDEQQNLPAIDKYPSRTGLGSLLTRFSQAFSNYLW